MIHLYLLKPLDMTMFVKDIYNSASELRSSIMYLLLK